MNYPCGVIRDLLPLYIDEVCNAESRQAVERHLSDCEACRNCCEAMRISDGFAVLEADDLEDREMADSLKRVKNRINRKIKTIVLAVAAAAIVFVCGFYLLFEAAIVNVPLENVSITANVYSLTELAGLSEDAVSDPDTVTIYSDEKDVSPTVEVKIPELGTVKLTEDTIEKCKYVSVVSIQSDKFIRTSKKEVIDDTIYIKGLKTSVLNNDVGVFSGQTIGLEFREINRIVFVDKNGAEILLWSK